MKRIKAKQGFDVTRIKQGHTVASLAKACGLNTNTLYGIERGDGLSPVIAKQIYDKMGLTFDDLFEIIEGG